MAVDASDSQGPAMPQYEQATWNPLRALLNSRVRVLLLQQQERSPLSLSFSQFGSSLGTSVNWTCWWFIQSISSSEYLNGFPEKWVSSFTVGLMKSCLSFFLKTGGAVSILCFVRMENWIVFLGAII